MKKILIALAFTAITFGGAQAQVCNTNTTPRHASKVKVHSKTTAQSCRMLPYEVCTINPDRKSVSCYKTTNPEGNTALTGVPTYYGTTGKIPGQPEQQRVKTIVIKGKSKGNYCKRDDQNKTTVCFDNSTRLVRDEDGYYQYR